MQKINNIIVLLIVFLVALGLGFIVGKSTSSEPKLSEAQLISDLEGKLESKIEKGLINFSVFYGEKMPLTLLSGEATEVKANTFVLTFANHYQGGKFFEYLNEPDYYQKRIKAGEDTEIVKLIPKDLSEVVFSPEEMTLPFDKEKASFSEIKEGTKVLIEAESGFNLVSTDEIVAKRIQIQE